MFSLIKLFFFIFIGYILFNIIRFIFLIGKSARTTGERVRKAGRKSGNSGKDESTSSNQEKNRIIELDKDQYKVE